MARNTPPSLITYQEIAYGSSGTPRSFTSITWLTGDVIVVISGGEGGASGRTVGPPTVTGLTFTAQQTHTAGANCEAGVWTAVAASGGSGAISSKSSISAEIWGASLWQWRGSDGVGTSFITATPSSTKTASATPTDTHSAWMWGVFDFSAAAVGTTVGTPTPTNTDESAVDGAGAYSVFVYDEDNQASGTATNYGISAGSSSGPFTIVGAEVLGTTTSTLVYPPANRIESTRRRAFFTVRRRPSIPVPLQDFLPQWRAPKAPPLSHARLPAIMRGRRSFVVPPQIPVPPKIPGNRIDSARSRILAVRRGRQTNPVLTQTEVVAPTWIPRRTTPKRIVAMTAHGKRTFVLSDQAGPARQYRASRLRLHSTRGKRTPVVADYTGFPRQSRAAKPKLPGSRRGRQWSAATMAQPVVTVTWPPPKLGARRRLLGSATRGRQFPPTPPQIPVPKPVWPVRISSARSRSVAFRRGHRNDPPWSASIPPASRAWVPAITRQRIYSGLPIRRGYRADPAWPIEAPPSAPGFAVSTDQTVWTTYAADAAVWTGAASDRVRWVVYTTDQPLRTVDAADGLIRDATASDAEV